MMQIKQITAMLLLFFMLSLSSCSISPQATAVGTWSVVSVAGESIESIAEKSGLSEEEAKITYIFNEDGTGVQETSSGNTDFTWSYYELWIKDHRMTFELSDSGSIMTIPISSGDVVLSRQ